MESDRFESLRDFRLISVKLLFSGLLNKSIGELELYQSEIKTLKKNLATQEKVNQEMLLKNNQVGFTIRKIQFIGQQNKKNHKSTLKTLQV